MWRQRWRAPCCCRVSCCPGHHRRCHPRRVRRRRLGRDRRGIQSVLIEKTRTVVSDGTGQHRITDLLPGTYSVTFTLTGFAVSNGTASRSLVLA